MKLWVTIVRKVTEATTIEMDVKANDVRAFMRGKGLGIERDDDWVDYADRYIEHQVDLQEAALQSNVDIESQGESEWEVKDVVRSTRGRSRALTQEQVYEIRHSWLHNNNQWAAYRSNPNKYTEPQNLRMGDLAARYRVSAGVIQHVIDHTGAYE